jgi:uncharacterized protein YggE
VKHRWMGWVGAGVICWACVGAPLLAGVTVRGSGEAQAQPDTLEIQVVISGSGQITGDALVKFRDSSRRGQEAYENLKMDGLAVQAGPLVFRSGSAAANANMFAAIAGTDQAAAVAGGVEISRAYTITLSGIDRLDPDILAERVGQLLDVARDTGATVQTSGGGNAIMLRAMGQAAGMGAAATFVVSDAVGPKREAAANAFADARQRAEQLASLAGGRLGKVVRIGDQSGGPMREAKSMRAEMIETLYGSGNWTSNNEESRLTSESLGPIPVRAALEVEFELLDGEGSP